MKPVKLIMTAFGPYKNRTVIDFEKINSRIFLITGDTGAGKTTIFDAIIFALYGKLDGGRDYQMMHSDYSDDKTPSEVIFEFSENGKIYKIKRVISYNKNSKKKFSSQDRDSVLTYPDGRVINKNTSSAVEQILGLSLDQFTKIAMLAQGEFRNFLDSNSIEKVEILGRLFDDSLYKKFTELLTAARDKLSHERNELEKSIYELMNTDTFPMPENISDDEKFSYDPSNEALEENLKILVDKTKSDSDNSEKLLNSIQEKRYNLIAEKERAKSVNKSFDEYDNLKTVYEKLSSKKNYYDEKEKLNGRLEKAVYIISKINEKRKISDETQILKNDIIKLNSHIDEIKILKNHAEKEVSDDAGLEKETDDLKIQSENLKHEIDTVYGELKNLLTLLEEAKSKNIEIENKYLSEKNRHEKLEIKIESNNKLIDELKDSGAEFEKAKISLQKSKENINKFSDTVRLINDIENKKKTLENLKSNYKKIFISCKEKSDSYNKIYTSFISCQAAVLGVKLEKELEEKGEAKCEVCGTVFKSGQYHHFASPRNSVISRDEVEYAKSELEAEEKRRTEKEKEIDASEIDIKHMISGAVSEIGIFSDKADEQSIFDRNFILQTEAEIKSEFDECENNFKLAESNYKNYEQLLSENNDLKNQENNIKSDIDILSSQLTEKNGEILNISGKIDTLKKSLRFDSREIAEKEKKKLDEKISENSEIIKSHRDKLNELAGILNTESGKLDTKNSELPKKKEELEICEKELSDLLTKNGFDSENEVVDLISPYGGKVNDFLKLSQTEVQNYKSDVKNNLSQLEKSENELSGKKRYPDIEIFDEKINLLDNEFNSENSKHKELYSLSIIYEKTYAQVKDKTDKLKKSSFAFEKLEKFATVANGSNNSATGKISFSSFVMITVFEEILNAANYRLDLITGGRYELARREGADKSNGISGLDVDIIDRFTGKQRSSKSISGGEGFEVSLALALGLSDTVCRVSGGRKIETLFIDEGFGTLDENRLDDAVNVLQGLTEENRLVGVISHVDRLKEVIPAQIVVKSSKENGSSVEIIND